MKSFFKIYLLILFIGNPIYQTRASTPMVITHNNKREFAISIKKIIIKHFHYPENLIAIKELEEPCKALPDKILQACLDDNANLNFPIINKKLLNSSYAIFKKTPSW